MMLLVGWGCVLSLVVYNKVEVTLHFNETIYFHSAVDG